MTGIVGRPHSLQDNTGGVTIKPLLCQGQEAHIIPACPKYQKINQVPHVTMLTCH